MPGGRGLDTTAFVSGPNGIPERTERDPWASCLAFGPRFSPDSSLVQALPIGTSPCTHLSPWLWLPDTQRDTLQTFLPWEVLPSIQDYCTRWEGRFPATARLAPGEPRMFSLHPFRTLRDPWKGAC